MISGLPVQQQQVVTTINPANKQINPQQTLQLTAQADMTDALFMPAGEAGGLNKTVQGNLQDLARIIASRASLMQALPAQVRDQAAAILGQAAVTPGTMTEGLTAVVHQFRQVSRQLAELTGSLAEAAVLPDSALQDLSAVLPRPAALPSPQQARQLAGQWEQAAQELAQPQPSPEKLAGIMNRIVLMLPQLGQQAGSRQPDQATVRAMAELLINEFLSQTNNVQGQDPKQAKAGSNLTDVWEQALPETVKTLTALKRSAPEVVQLWSLLKTLAASEWKDLSRNERTKAAETLKQLVQTFSREGPQQNESRISHTIFNYAFPLTFGDNTQPYPVYLHVYRQQQSDNKEQGDFETWLRVVMATENLGSADVVFRLYDGNCLDVRIGMGNQEALAEFKETIPDIRAALEHSSLAVHNITTGKTR